MNIQIQSRALARVLKALLPFCSKDATRAHMCGVCFDTTGGALSIVASDGHTMASATDLLYTKTEDEGELIIPTHEIKALISLCKSRTDFDVVLTRESVSVGSSSMSISPSSASFPPWRAILPKSYGEPEPVGLNPLYVARAGKACDTFRVSSEIGTLFTQGGALDAVTFVQNCPDTGKLTVVVMPFRI